MKTKILTSLAIFLVAARIWLTFSISGLSNQIDKLTKDYSELEIRLEQHRIFRDSFLTDNKFKNQVLDSATKGELNQKSEIEKTLIKYKTVFSDKGRLTKKLKVYEAANNWTTGFIVLILLGLGIRLLKRR